MLVQVSQPAMLFVGPNHPGNMTAVAVPLHAYNPAQKPTAAPATEPQLYSGHEEGEPETAQPLAEVYTDPRSAFPVIEPQVHRDNGQGCKLLPEVDASEESNALPMANTTQQVKPLPFLVYVSQQTPQDTISDPAGTDKSAPLSTAPTSAAPLPAATSVIQWVVTATAMLSLELFVAATRRPFMRACMLVLTGLWLLWTSSLALLLLRLGMASSAPQLVSKNELVAALLHFFLLCSIDVWNVAPALLDPTC